MASKYPRLAIVVWAVGNVEPSGAGAPSTSTRRAEECLRRKLRRQPRASDARQRFHAPCELFEERRDRFAGPVFFLRQRQAHRDHRVESTPVSTRCRLRKLRSNRPAPSASIIASAISATISP